MIPENYGRLKECNEETQITVKFKPTVPVVGGTDNDLPIQVIVPGAHLNKKTTVVSTCVVRLKHGMTPKDKPQSVVISPSCSNLNRQGSSLVYRFTIENIQHADPFWWSYQLPSIKVNHLAVQEYARIGGIENNRARDR